VNSNKTASVLIIYTGGTIGMVKEPSTGALVPFPFEQITEQIPELRKFGYNLKVISFDPLIDSSDMTPETWIVIGEIIGSHYHEFDGFVILHGSDTMAYTASALSFMLENLAKPVILTGSQLPAGEIRTDAKENLITAIELAAHTHPDYPCIPEVCIYFDYRLFRGNRTSKYNSAKFEAFQSVNFPPLAEAGIKISFDHQNILPPPSSESIFRVQNKLEPNVGILKLFPGILPEFVKSILKTPGMKALVLEAFGTGNAPKADWFIDMIEEAVSNGLIILNITQCGGGYVDLGAYETGHKLQMVGVIGGGDMTTESALAKLMYLFGKGFNPEEIQDLLFRNIRGEYSSLNG
jgi:L-asparaginase